jgi:hypothetical protein
MAYKFRRPWLPMPRWAVVHRLHLLGVDQVMSARRRPRHPPDRPAFPGLHSLRYCGPQLVNPRVELRAR